MITHRDPAYFYRRLRMLIPLSHGVRFFYSVRVTGYAVRMQMRVVVMVKVRAGRDRPHRRAEPLATRSV